MATYKGLIVGVGITYTTTLSLVERINNVVERST